VIKGMNLKRFCYLLLILAVAGSVSQSDPLITWLFLVNLLTLALYGADKCAAKNAWRRVPESTLLLFGFVGGWPAAICGQAIFRHKTQKQPFKKYFIISVMMNIVVAGVAYGLYLHYGLTLLISFLKEMTGQSVR